MLGNAMQKADSVTSDPPVPSAATGQPNADERQYPDKLDAALFRVAAVCGMATIMALLDTTVVSVAQRTFAAQFGSTLAVVSWTMAGYMLALATVIPVTGWAVDRFGTKRLFMGAVFVFTLGSLLCALAPNILALIMFRVVQGLGGGMLMPLSSMILTREAGPQRLGRLIAIGGIPLVLAPIGAPILGGWVIDTYGWEWIFLINLPIGIATIFLAAILFPRDRPEPSEALDFIGALLLSPGVAIFLCGVSSIPGRHTVADRYVLIPVIIGLILITAFVLHAWYRTDHPLIDLRLLKNRVVTQANLTLLVFTVGYVGAGLTLPSYFQLVMNETPMQSAMRLVPQALGAALTMPLAGMYADKRGPGKVVLIGLPLIAAGLAIFAFGVARHADYLPTLLVGLAIMGLGIGCTTAPLGAAVVQALSPQQIARGTTLVSVNLEVSSSIGAALMAVIVTTQISRNDIIAGKAASLPSNAGGHGPSADASGAAHQALPPDVASALLNNLSHAYTTVFVLAVALVAFTIIPAAFLPKSAPVRPTDD
ncbi:DHA2 family efflux MFS transporter permease subunit [Mycobacterium scrofulaceum]|uniref:MFS transporter n=1 Tax=Mycobacterium scrofulaceum TaxID=1783 RepID=A0A1A2U0Q1_MYCSC|nr:DHA2 family efflux MFS transporter permease subunit [Mycobacterium scrofulaceum]OBH81907.1 MFS transporter [Mycobacterium scrofulaceum]